MKEKRKEGRKQEMGRKMEPDVHNVGKEERRKEKCRKYRKKDVKKE